ncbi:hypothetical protein [Clostridium sp. DJ247]|uniref:hypothetical protein n=1 Tax=Clostridium sp. DJ247 TaxID=2726188 RepID=UPI00162AE6CA|nr:hypothetical protein [Clostridium sp. DJ247]MBC2581391.1 hypothetical protein [Clostridium sp. DJ247]
MNIFYSWQSDLDNKSNRNFIQKALYKAVSDMEIDENVGFINIDRDTKDTSGAVNIRDTILHKILQSQILVYDVSIINNDKEHKKCINSNVAFELGFGVCASGWEKIILVFNSNYGDIEDVPFDIRGHRVVQYSFNGDASLRASSMKELTRDLKGAIETIINSKNFKVDTGMKLSNEEIKIKNDYEKLNIFLSNIHIPTFDNSFKLINESNVIMHDIFHYFDGIKAFITSVDFYFYDEELKINILEFYKYLNSILSYDNYFTGDNGKVFKLNTDSQKVESNFRRDAGLSMKGMKNLLDYIKSTYPNIDFNETNKMALSDKQKYEKIFED